MKRSTHTSFIELIYARMDRSGGPDACWPWTGSRTVEGYGRVHLLHQNFPAHRLVYELHYGTPPAGRLVCHKCDNPICCNPAHLFLGTNADNLRDMAEKQRSSKGERNGRAKLSADDVRQIRALYAEGGWTQQQLAHRFGVTQTVVGEIARRTIWKSVE